jgi:siroheme synthase-like protein
MRKTPPEALNFFPIMLRLDGQKCLVVGGGKVATEKIAGLLAHGAEVTVVSPCATPAIQKQARAGALQWKNRRFRPPDAKGAFLAIAATNSSAVNSAVFRASRTHGVLCNAVDDPENCDFFYPAVVHRGPLQIAISTNGQSPAAAARLRRELEKQFGPEWGEWLKQIGRARASILRTLKSTGSRRAKLLDLASERSFREFLRGRNIPSAKRSRES